MDPQTQTKMNQSTYDQNGIIESLCNQLEDDVLEHHGIAGQSWGKRHGPPYPLSTKASKAIKSGEKITKAEAKQMKEKERTIKRINNSQEKKRKDAAKAARKVERDLKRAERTAEKVHRQKAKYAKNAKSLYKHRDMYSYEEIEGCLKKFEWENRIKDYKQKDFSRAKSNVATFSDMSKSVASTLKNGVDIYNVIAALDNTFGEGTLKRIDMGNGQKKKKKDEDDD